MKTLLATRKFAPFFWTQFFGAFNDNIFKNALVIFIAFKIVSETESALYVQLASGLFVLPFFLFSPLAGQIADKYDKAKIIQWTKLAECGIMTLGALSLIFENIFFMIFVLFLMAVQSTFFGPVKYSILPQTLHERELMEGTGLVEMGTFIAILTGTILGGLLIKEGTTWVGLAVVVVAVPAAAGAALMYAVGLSTIEIFGIVALLNLIVTLYIFTLLPEFVLRFGMWVMARTIYRFKYHGRDKIPHTGAVLVIANHVSFIDWFLLSAVCQRPIRFVMYYKIFNIPVLKQIFKLGGAIPIAGAKENPKIKEQAFESISEALKNGEVVGLFPEGMITHDGELNLFRRGVEEVLQRNQVPVVPIAIKGVWGSFFSRKGGPAMGKLPKPKRRKITMEVGNIIDKVVDANQLQSVIAALMTKDKKQQVS